MKYFFRILVFILMSMSLFCCKSVASLAEIETLKEVVANKNYVFIANSATPIAFANTIGIGSLLPPGSNIANISLSNIDNFLKISNDSIKMDLPFYGERHIVNGYGENNGLAFIGKTEETKSIFNSKKNSYSIRYQLKSKNESFQLSLILFTSKKATLTVNSSSRSTISYDGYWKEN